MLTDYCGAGSRLAPERGLALSADAWGWMPKVDGCYARVSTDRRGRVFSVLTRAGRPLREARDLVGLLVGAPDSVLHGELEAHTEAGIRQARVRGWRALHLFDATRHAGRDVSAMPALDRHALLTTDRAALVAAGTVNPWADDEHGQAHAVTTGRYAKRIPRDWRRFPLVSLERDARSLWTEHVERGGGEGLVAVRLAAPAGARDSKRKIKATDTLDCTVVSCSGGAALLSYRTHLFAVSARGRWSTLTTGTRVEVAADGWYESTTAPRFARLVRVRGDLQ